MPSQLAGLIKEQKALIEKTPFDDERQPAFHEKLWELEIQKYGAKKSARKTANVKSADEKESAPAGQPKQISEEQRRKIVEELRHLQKKL